MERTTFLSSFGIDDTFLAHTPSETLTEHSLLTFAYYQKIIKAKNLQTQIDNLIKKIDNDNFDFIKEMFENAILLHDLGKKNPFFQAQKMHNEKFAHHKTNGDSNHSLQGSLEYIQYYKAKIYEKFKAEEYFRLIYILYSFSFAITKHHGKLHDFSEHLSSTEDIIKEHEAFKNAKEFIHECMESHFELYILNKILFSLLISSDYYATTEYMAFKNQKSFNDFGLLDSAKKDELAKLFTAYMESFGKPEGINTLREELSNEASKNLSEHKDKFIYYLEAPTGSGKTLTSIRLAMELLQCNKELNKLFYIFPFNTLVEQTKTVFHDIFKDKLETQVINSITPIKDDTTQEDEESNYENSYMSRLFYHSSFIITTHVNFFNILFGTSKEDNFPLWQLSNSVIVLDEIQSYNNELWWYMIEFFEKYATSLNIKIIIMSATLPKLDYFIAKKDSFANLLSQSKRDYFFKHPYFKNRVDINYLNLERKTTLKELCDKLEEEIKNYKKILFEFISKKSAREFYELIREKFQNVYELSGDDNKAYRQYVIDQTKDKEKSMIIVATQVIEAGIDIDMDLGFKDISTLDSEEQFMGRINRSCKKNHLYPKVYFFDMDEAKYIYKNDNRLSYDLKDKTYQDILHDKEFSKYYENVLREIKNDGNHYSNGLLTNYNHFINDVEKLNYKTLAKKMTLISSQMFTLYFPFMIDISKYTNVEEFKNIEDKFLTDKKLDGQKVWDEFLKLNEIKNFAQMKIKKSKINSLMQFFTFSLYKNYEGQRPFIGEEIHGFYYVEDYSTYITDENKFDRKKYNKKSGDIFL